ncbi:MAG: PilZ domain-containing protein [Thermosediminibacteraceae bacterium]|nr:PilZ domain-containing protein [Thermosediminibacteraceae bacterium]
MGNNSLEIGMRVEIEVVRDDEKIILPTKVEDLGEDRIYLGMPFLDGKLFFLESDEPIKIYYKKNDCFYFVRAKVVEKRYAPIPIIGVILLAPPEKNQRRDYFRVQVIKRIRIRPLKTENWMKAFLMDLSASGAMIYFGKELEKGEVIEIKLPLESREIDIKARVVRIAKDPVRRVHPYNIGVQFIDLKDQERDEIIKFVLAEQRKLRQKGYI